MYSWVWSSPEDPWWVAVLLVVTRLIVVGVVATWAMQMRLSMPRLARHRWPWSQPWAWCLSGWLFAVGAVTFVDLIHVFFISHIRAQDAFGQAFRLLEIGVSLHLAAWSVLAYWRWTHPETPVDLSAVFGVLATAMPIMVTDDQAVIQYTTRSMRALVGANGGGRLVGRNVTEIMPERYRAAHLAGMKRYLETRETTIIGSLIPIMLLHTDGSEVPIYLSLNTADVEGRPWFIGEMWRRNTDDAIWSGAHESGREEGHAAGVAEEHHDIAERIETGRADGHAAGRVAERVGVEDRIEAGREAGHAAGVADERAAGNTSAAATAADRTASATERLADAGESWGVPNGNGER